MTETTEFAWEGRSADTIGELWPVRSAYQRQYGNRPWVPAPVLVRPALGTVAR